MIKIWNARRNHLCVFANAVHGRPPAPWKMIYWQALSANHQLLVTGGDMKRIPFLTSDAGMSLKTKERSGKLKGEAGMYLRTKVVSSIRRECC
jgi:hypothetical protein